MEQVKSFQPHLILLDIKLPSLLKRAYPVTEQEALSCNGVTLHLESSKIEFAKRQAELTENELKILYYLFKHAGAICIRADIVEHLWDNRLYVDDNALSVNIVCYYGTTIYVIRRNLAGPLDS